MRTILLSLFSFVFILMMLDSCRNKVKTGTITVENLQSAYRNEINAVAEYNAFSQKAIDENLMMIASLFAAVSKSESIHAQLHRAILLNYGIIPPNVEPEFEVRNTEENLRNSIEGEKEESTDIYIDYIISSQKEGMPDATRSFNYAKDAEMKHTGYYTAALAALTDGHLSSLSDSFLVCPVCGQTFEKREPDLKCSSCRNPREKFISIP